jgi:hypothetical protein
MRLINLMKTQLFNNLLWELKIRHPQILEKELESKTKIKITMLIKLMSYVLKMT